MKKSLFAVLAVAFAMSLVACGAKSTSPVGPDCKAGSTDVRCQGG